MFAQIDALMAKLEKRRPLTQLELKRLQEEFLIEFTYNSNAIEGNTLTLRETALVLEGVTINKKPLKDHLEAVGHKEAFLYVLDLVAEKSPMSERIIKEIHSLVLMDRPKDKGIYRQIPVMIMGAYQEPPQPYLVPEQMELLIAEQKITKQHPIENAALFHLDFEGIHPFIDGNGRTGRLVLNLMLMQYGYPPIDVKFTDRDRYYACFDSYYKDKTAAPMVKMVTEYLEKQLDRYLKILKQKEELDTTQINEEKKTENLDQFKEYPAQTQNNLYTGIILNESERRLVQHVGRNIAVMHDKSLIEDCATQITNQNVEISYLNGKGKIKILKRDLSQNNHSNRTRKEKNKEIEL